MWRTLPTVLISFSLVLGLAAFMKHTYFIDVDSVTLCPDNSKLDFPIRNFKFVKFNRTHKSLSYDISYTYPLDETVSGGLTVERWGDGGWIEIPFMPLRRNICQYMVTYFKGIWKQVMEGMKIKHPEVCPVPVGNYSVRNLAIDFSDINIPFWSGRLKLTLFAQKDGSKTKSLCMSYILNVKEKI